VVEVIQNNKITTVITLAAPNYLSGN